MATHKSEAMAKQEVNSPLIITTGIISILLLVVAAMGTEAWFRYEEQAELEDKWQVSQNTWLQDIRKQEVRHLGGAPITQDQKTKTVPIERAMEMIVAQNQGKAKQGN